MYIPFSSPTQLSLPLQNEIISIFRFKHQPYIALCTFNEVVILYKGIILTTVRRSDESVNKYGRTKDICVRNDGQIVMLMTETGYLIQYLLLPDRNTSHVLQCRFTHSPMHPSNTTTAMDLMAQALTYGCRSVVLRFRMVVKIDAGIDCIQPLEDSLLIATKDGDLLLLPYTSSPSTTPTKRPSFMNAPISAIAYDRPMSLFTFITEDGCAYAVQLKDGEWVGHQFHSPKTQSEYATHVSINARFSIIAIGSEDGQITIYNVKDYSGSIPFSHTLSLKQNGIHVADQVDQRVQCLAWSHDGYSLFAGYACGWALWSVYGKLGGNSFGTLQLIADQLENASDSDFMTGVKDACWNNGATEMLIVADSKSADKQTTINGHSNRTNVNLWCIQMARSAMTGLLNPDNVSRAMLLTSDKLLLYRGYDQPDLSAINPESVLWQHIQLPAVYLIDNAPIRQCCISKDGRYIAIAGRRGLAHYSVQSGRWKTFINDNMEQDFAVRGGMCWFQHILIAAVESDSEYELRLYSRETDLDNALLLHVEIIQSPVLLITITNSSVLILTADNTLTHFLITVTKDTVKLIRTGQISFNGIVHAPTRIRSLSWILPKEQLMLGKRVDDINVATLVFLFDGQLVLLKPNNIDGEVTYELRVLNDKIEHYFLVNSNSPVLPNSIWAFDGHAVKLWTNALEIPTSPDDSPSSEGLHEPIAIPVDFYPLSILTTRGIIIGTEPEVIQSRTSKYVIFKFLTGTRLFLNYVFQRYLTESRVNECVDLAASFQHLAYFSHALEILLHDVLDDETDKIIDANIAVLPKVVTLLREFPHFMDVIVGCTRKTEVASWETLFKIVGNPKELFEKCLKRGHLKTAGGYLLILQTMDELEQNGEDMIRLFAKAKDAADWDLCKELARFLTSLDNSGRLLKQALSRVDLALYPKSELLTPPGDKPFIIPDTI